MTFKLVFLLAGITLTGLGIPLQASAAPGDLDTAFGQDGFVVTDIGADTNDQAADFIQLADGKILAAGAITDPMAPALDGVIVRYNADGTLDQSFNGDGKAFLNTSPDIEFLGDIALDPNGDIIGCGITDTDPDPGMEAFALYVVKANSNGDLVSGFGTGGLVTRGFGMDEVSFAVACAPQSDGKILLTSVVLNTVTNDVFTLVARYDSDGSLDTSYGTNGEVELMVGSAFAVAEARVLTDNKLLLIGFDGDIITGDSQAELVRLDNTGALDNSFGTGGAALLNAGATIDTRFSAAVLQSDGKIVAVGTYDDGGPSDFLIARFNGDGSPDTTFGPSQQGFEHTDINGEIDSANGLLIQANDKILVVGRGQVGGQSDMAIVRYNSDGSLDDQATFSEDGIQTVNFPGDVRDNAIAVFAQNDGKLLIAGESGATDMVDFALTRLLADDGDLSLTLSAGADMINLGEEIVFSIAVTNNGAESAGGVTVNSDMPDELSLVSATPDQGSCNDELPLNCDLGVLDGDTTTNLSITALATDISNSVDFTAAVSGEIDDSDAANNSATVNFSIATGSGGCSLIRRRTRP